MEYIEIKKSRKSLFSSKVVFFSSSQNSFNLRFDYVRSKRLRIFNDDYLTIETDGSDYINYLCKDKIFQSETSTLKEAVLACHGEKIIYEWTKKIGLPLISFSKPIVNVYSENGTFKLMSLNSWKGRVNRLEMIDQSDFLFAVGVLAYRWTMEENSDYVTA